ncbi:MAG: TrkA C-terminal domain-containing protein [Planctomycetales bacterium]|nr:TrkA C-terminal domain-containing protein [Planctomycetales bacterium]
MIAVITLLVALSLTLLITRVATVALTLTGMSRPSARFQARSALSGCGFTTNESEAVMRHPVRRRVIMTLMLLGNAGIVTVIGTLMASLAATTQTSPLLVLRNVAVIIIGIGALAVLASSQWVDRWLSRWIERGLRRWGNVEACDYMALFRLANGYTIVEKLVEDDDWLAHRSLIELNLPAEGVLVLGIQRDGGNYLGAPRGATAVQPGDTLILYGLIERLDELDARKADRAGAAARDAAVLEQQQIVTVELSEEGASTPDAPTETL